MHIDFTFDDQKQFLENLGYTIEEITYKIFNYDYFDDEYDLPSETIVIAFKGERPIQDNYGCSLSFRHRVPPYVFSHNRISGVFNKEIKNKILK